MKEPQYTYGGEDDFYDEDASPGVVSPEKTTLRRLLIVLLDISASMAERADRRGTPPIEELNRRFKALLLSGELNRMTNLEIAIAAFYTEIKGSRATPKVIPLPLGVPVRSDSPIHWAAHATWGHPGDLQASGGTPLGTAVERATGWIATRLTQWWEEGADRDCRPVLVVLTDGVPWSGDNLKGAISSVHKMESSGDLAFWIAGTGAATDSVYVDLANKGNFVHLGSKAIESFIRLMSMSMKAAEEGGHEPVESLYRRLRDKLNQLEGESVAGA